MNDRLVPTAVCTHCAREVPQVTLRAGLCMACQRRLAHRALLRKALRQ